MIHTMKLRHHLIILSIAAFVFAILLAIHANDWTFSCIGDEWAVFDRAMNNFRTGLINPSQIFAPVSSGVYAVHAPFITSMQSLVMAVFGQNNFGWRMSSILAFVFSVFPFYYIARGLLNDRIALICSLFLLSSYYLNAEALWGYGWGQMRLYALVATALAIHFYKNTNYLSAILLGISCSICLLAGGLCTYVPLLIFFIFLYFSCVKIIHYKYCITLLLAILATSKIPQMVFSKSDGLLDQIKQLAWKTCLGPVFASWFGGDWSINVEKTDISPFKQLALHLINSITAPITYQGHTHFIQGNIFNPVMGSLIIFGLLLALIRSIHEIKWSFFFLAFLPALFLAGALSPHHELSATRLHFLVPFWIFCLGISLSICEKYTSKSIVLIVSFILISLNIYESHKKLTVTVPAVQDFAECAISMKVISDYKDKNLYFVGLGWNLFDAIAEHYELTDHVFFTKESPLNDITKDKNTILIFKPSVNPSILSKYSCTDYIFHQKKMFFVCQEY